MQYLVTLVPQIITFLNNLTTLQKLIKEVFPPHIIATWDAKINTIIEPPSVVSGEVSNVQEVTKPPEEEAVYADTVEPCEDTEQLESNDTTEVPTEPDSEDITESSSVILDEVVTAEPTPVVEPEPVKQPAAPVAKKTSNVGGFTDEQVKYILDAHKKHESTQVVLVKQLNEHFGVEKSVRTYKRIITNKR